MNFSFESFVDGSYDYDKLSEKHTSLHIFEENGDIGGGRISPKDIDKIKDFPNADVISISGLRQDTFEYFIKNYGKQFKAIRFFKNKFVEDWSLLSTLKDLEYVYFFYNQRITSLWDMSCNTALTGLCIEDFSRLTSINGIEKAPSLKEMRIGNAVWEKMTLESLMPLANTLIEKFMFYGKSIADNDYSFLADMLKLRQFDFRTNLLTTEQVAWIVANLPELDGFALKAKLDCELYDSDMKKASGTLIVGKGKPSLIYCKDLKRIEKYEREFEFLKEKYKGISYKDAFPK